MDDKKQKILEVSLKEFAKNGYKNTSTNVIVKKSGISKGLLFHYFKNKKGLFYWVFEYCIDTIVEKMFVLMKSAKGDLFDVITKRYYAKLQLAADEPDAYAIIYDAYMNLPENMKIELFGKYSKAFMQEKDAMINNIDTSNLREDIDIEKALEFITMFLEGLTNKYLPSLRQLNSKDAVQEVDKIYSEYTQYIDLLKHGLYKK